MKKTNEEMAKEIIEKLEELKQLYGEIEKKLDELESETGLLKD